MTQQLSTLDGDSSTVSTAEVVTLRFEHHRDAVGVGEPTLRLSWTVVAAADGWRQVAYQLEALSTDSRLRGATDRISSEQSVLVDWPFEPLSSRERIAVRVRVWDEDGSASAWSDRSTVEVGLLNASDWSARFITPSRSAAAEERPCPLLRREFDVRPGVASARLYITALGVYEAEINGQVVGDQVLAPGWTSYNHRLRYQTHDVRDLLHEGPNAIGATLSDGWYRGRLGFNGGRRNIYGDVLGLLAQLEIQYEDGTTEVVSTDESWRASDGPVLASSLYDGETHDARKEQPGWSTSSFDDQSWSEVRLLERDLSTLVAPTGPPVRRIELVPPVAVLPTPSGRTILDFGQNLVGRLRISVQGGAGRTITLRHAEVLEGGELCLRPLRHAKATDHYTLRGGERETWEPRFTFHGFRYAEIENWPGEVRADDVRAVVCHSDLERTGWFECSDPMINQLHENIVWSMRGNFLDIPTDCPQRDERLGWTGDIQVFAPTACFLYDSAGFLVSWLRDLAAEQTPSGVVPFVVPNPMGGDATAAAAWGDAAVVVPWVHYECYGDSSVLADQFDSMRAWVDHIAARAGEDRLWNEGFQFGDWLDPAAPPDNPAAARTDPHLVATAYFARSAELLGKAAGVLGRDEDERRYTALAEEVRSAFRNEYTSATGRLVSDATTAYALAIQFGLLREPEQRRHAGARLAALARSSGYRISTGFVGTPLICDALCSVGEYDAAFRLLVQRECPSWLYPVTMGATTIWERWDSLLPDGSVNPGEMTSFNHYALGAVADWLHRTVAGLAPTEPGYRRIEIRPRPGGGITSARARVHTPYGPAESSWKLDGRTLDLKAVIPPNTTATISLPGAEEEPVTVGGGTYQWSHQMPARRLPPVSLDTPLGELVEDTGAWKVVVGHVPQFGSSEDGPPGFDSLPLRQLLFLTQTPRETQDALDAALAGLTAERNTQV